MALLLARHGEKESEDGPVNFQLRLTPAGVLGVQATARALLAAGLVPARIICSPFPRCVQTAALYAAALLPAPQRCIAIEPGLCEVLSADLGAKGLGGAPPAWTPEELAAIAAPVALDAAYAPIVAPGELRLESSRGSRDEVVARVQRLSAALRAALGAAGGGGLVLYVSHGSPVRRLADALCPQQAPFGEPAMGTVLHVVGARAVATFGPTSSSAAPACTALVALPASRSAAVADEILPRLFIANAAFAAEEAALASIQATHIVTAAVLEGFGALFPASFIYHEVRLQDAADAALTPHLAPATAFMDAALSQGGTVLVHCQVGTSRSVSLLLHYLMARRGMALRGALAHVMGVRARNPRAPYTHPNRGFWKELMAEEVRLRGGEASLALEEYFDKFSTGKNLALLE
jgi:broad specificity phosphatase PhoE